MRLYPDIPARRVRTIVRDLLVVVLLVCFALIGLWVHDVIDKLAVLGEGVRKVGDAVPFGGGDPIEDLGRSGEERVHDVANLLGLLFFGLPATMLLARYVPRRAEQVRTLTAASRVLVGGDPRLVAMRAAFSLPYGTLLAYSEDPLADLRAERYDGLVAAAFEQAGLRPSTPTASASAPRPQPAARRRRSAST